MAKGKSTEKIHDLIIIGGGPAALTAGLYAARAALVPLLFEGAFEKNPGGQLTQTTDIENWPGTAPEGISGFDLVTSMKEQAVHFGAKVIGETVNSIEPPRRGRKHFVLKAGEMGPKSGGSPQKEYLVRAVILATGADAKYLGLPGEKEYYNQGVSACATCDGALPRFRGKPIVVVGGGDTAMEEAMFLSRFASTVHLVHRRDKFRASKIMADRVLANKKIKVHWNTVVVDILGDAENGVTAVKLKTTTEKKVTEKKLKVSGYFAAIGHKPNSELVSGLVELDSNGYVVPGKGRKKDGLSATKVQGLFVAGDVMDHRYRQAITAAGAGCMAAIDATRWLER